MSTYNADEIVKVKHILALAEHIVAKIDGTNATTDDSDLANAADPPVKTTCAITATLSGASITVTPVAYQETTTDATSLIITLPNNYTTNPNCKIGVPYKSGSDWLIPVQNQGSFNVGVKIQTPETDNFKASNVVTVTIAATA